MRNREIKLSLAQIARVNELIKGGSIIYEVSIVLETITTCKLCLKFKDQNNIERNEVIN